MHVWTEVNERAAGRSALHTQTRKRSALRAVSRAQARRGYVSLPFSSPAARAARSVCLSGWRWAV
eukprot:scaffold252025_cov28-Tisochrysis_lutea.AAC.1